MMMMNNTVHEHYTGDICSLFVFCTNIHIAFISSLTVETICPCLLQSLNRCHCRTIYVTLRWNIDEA